MVKNYFTQRLHAKQLYFPLLIVSHFSFFLFFFDAIPCPCTMNACNFQFKSLTDSMRRSTRNAAMQIHFQRLQYQVIEMISRNQKKLYLCRNKWRGIWNETRFFSRKLLLLFSRKVKQNLNAKNPFFCC